ncbi:unnamed protein product [Bemisia tabaci]|uniref:AAA-ATPase-like domain-containing protein n=1 Tax=Bemisia tabaci TaxID=7038 RepID=A0A9P0F8R0_BEMTA|nr:unnamed protein product [Bemisia tabaci]
MYLLSVLVIVLLIHFGNSAGDFPLVELYSSPQFSRSLKTQSNPRSLELGNRCAELPELSDASLEVLFEKNCYVDKTDYLYKMVKETQIFWFLARPRRFGKTLLIDTMEAFFKGEAGLFEDTNIYRRHIKTFLWIIKYRRGWPKHPVVRLDFSLIEATSFSKFYRGLLALLQRRAKRHDNNLDTKQSVGIVLCDLIEQLEQKYGKKVVILIDEYDSPYTTILSANKDEASQVLETLQDFFKILKGMYKSIRFCFTTGITRLALSDFFSGANAAEDISMNPDFAGIVGFNETELTNYFGRFIERVAERKGNTSKEILDEMKKWYDGFQFTIKYEPLYNPISVIEYLRSDGVSIDSYSGTGGSSQSFDQELKQFPREAFELLLRCYFEDGADQSYVKIEDDGDELEEIPELCLEKEELAGKFNFDEQKNPTALVVFLYRSGFLSIRSYDNTTSRYILNITNLELRTNLAGRLTYTFTGMSTMEMVSYGTEMVQHLAKHKWQSFIDTLKAHLRGIPYNFITHQRIQIEVLFQISFYETLKRCTLKSVSWTMPVRAYSSGRGQSDIVMTIGDTVYIFELKMDDNLENSLYECKEKYLPAFLHGSAENVACFAMKFHRTGDVSSFGVAIFSRTGKLHTEVGKIKLPTSFNKTEAQAIAHLVNKFRENHAHSTIQPDKLLEFFQQIACEQVTAMKLVDKFTNDKLTFCLLLDEIRKALPRSYDNLKGVIHRLLSQLKFSPKTK